MLKVFAASIACLLFIGCSERTDPTDSGDASTAEETTDAGSLASDAGSGGDGGTVTLSPGCGDIGEPATGTCQSGALTTTTPIRGLACDGFGVKFDGVAVALNFDRRNVGKTAYRRDGSSGQLLEVKPTLDGCSGGEFASLNFRDSAGTQRLELFIANLDLGNPQTADASTHSERSGCMISANVWDADGNYVGVFESPPVNGIYPGQEEQALALQSGTYSCSRGLGNPLEMTFDSVKLVNLKPGPIGDRTLEFDGKLSVSK